LGGGSGKPGGGRETRSGGDGLEWPGSQLFMVEVQRGGKGVLSFGCFLLGDVRLTQFGYLALIIAVFLLKFGEFVLDELVMAMN
nr:hypothetical protein [Tanacetum cinerariifolium]